MQRLSAVGDIMAEPASVENDRLLHRLRRLMLCQALPVFTERSLQAAIDLHRDVGLESDVFGQVVVGTVSSCGALLVEFAVELVASAGKRVEPGDALQIDKMVGFLRILQG